MSKVKIYSNIGCGACAAAKIFMDKQKIEYEELRIDQDVEAFNYLKELGVSSVPLIVIGETQIRGFNPSLILQALKED